MKQKAFVFDLDGTLFETSAEILGSPSSPDFIEFGDATMLLTESFPLPLLYFAKEVHDEGHKVYILTARKNIMAKAIRKLLRGYGIDAEFVFCVGDRGFDIPSYKAEILSQLSTDLAVYYYDDEVPNLILAQNSGAKVFKVFS